jgi:Na+/H+ antiporter NhaC
VISAEDRTRLRSAPAYRRAVWGLRLGALVPLLMLCMVVLVGVGVAPKAGVPVFVVAFASTAVGVGLVWSSMLPLEKIKKSVLTKYQLDPVERAVLLNGMLLRDLVRFRRIPPGHDANHG